MTLDDLLNAVRDRTPTAEDIARLKARLAAAELRFEKEAQERSVTEEFLNRSYTI